MAVAIPRATTANATVPAPAARARGRGAQRAGSSSPLHRGDWRMAWLLIAPAGVGFIIFAAYPSCAVSIWPSPASKF